MALVCALVIALSACVSLSNLAGGSGEKGPMLFSLGGTVEGLDGASITLDANGMQSLTLSKDGAFVFPTQLSPGERYTVTITHAPENHACSVKTGEGLVANADVTDVAIFCLSTNAELSNLVLSSGALSPSFAPATLFYGVNLGSLAGRVREGALPEDALGRARTLGPALRGARRAHR